MAPEFAADYTHSILDPGVMIRSSRIMSLNTPEPMRLALAEAQAAAQAGEVPVGAVLVDVSGHIIALSHNRTIRDRDPTAHAEMLALREASAKMGSERLIGCDLYVTLEPCAMCAGAISHARLRRLYFAADDPKMGAVENGPRLYNQPNCHHRPEVYGGIGASAAGQLLRDFFRNRRFPVK